MARCQVALLRFFFIYFFIFFCKSSPCASYPRLIAIPRHVSDDQLNAIASFRTLSRVPALTFLHPDSGAAMVRCSQPMSGITQVRKKKIWFQPRQFFFFFFFCFSPTSLLFFGGALGGGRVLFPGNDAPQPFRPRAHHLRRAALSQRRLESRCQGL
jgi:hypothetical protein